MSSNYAITIISDPACKDCKRMYSIIVKTLQDLKLSGLVNIIKIDSGADNAIDVAVQKKIYDLPGCSIGEVSIYGKDFKDEDIKNAIVKLIS